MTGTYVVFFFLEPVEGEYLYENRNNNGEYTQMAICNTYATDTDQHSSWVVIWRHYVIETNAPQKW